MSNPLAIDLIGSMSNYSASAKSEKIGPEGPVKKMPPEPEMGQGEVCWNNFVLPYARGVQTF